MKYITSDYAKGMAKYLVSQLDVENGHPANLSDLGKEIHQEVLSTDNDSLEVYLAFKIEEYLESGISKEKSIDPHSILEAHDNFVRQLTN